MPFNTYTFIIFFILVLIIHYSLSNWKYQKVNLLCASYLFYSAWNPVFVLLLFFSTFCDWHFAKNIYKTNDRKSKKIYLLLSILVNLGLLGYFKYGGFILTNSIFLVNALGLTFTPLPADIILPVGISFYTFQTLSYALDVYKGKIKPSTSFLDYALYVSFFPQLVAGPIVRASEFIPQCIHPKKASSDQLGWGVSLLVIGLFMKLIMADAIFSPVVDSVYASPVDYGFFETWIAIFSFSSQIFCDFAGYSTCALGIALCFGFILPDNFNAPYASFGFKEFWQRWHITLSSWLRDYLYISLGGSRRSQIRTYVNLILTMLIGGLWHGASWMFVVWGGLHGFYLVIERKITDNYKNKIELSLITKSALILFTYLIVSITWVFFRADDLNNARSIFENISSPHGTGALTLGGFELAASASLMLIVWHMYRRHYSINYFFTLIKPTGRFLILFVQLLIILLFASGDDRAFIYFQF